MGKKSRKSYSDKFKASAVKMSLKPTETNKLLRDAVYTVHAASRGTYSRRRIAAKIAKQGPAVSLTRIEQRTKELGIQGISLRSFVTTMRDNTKLENSPNLVKDEDLVAKKKAYFLCADEIADGPWADSKYGGRFLGRDFLASSATG